MAHDLEIVDGKASFFSARGITAWHNLGQVVKGVPTAKEAIELANLNWTVAMEKAFTHDGTELAGVRVSRRNTDCKVLGVVGERYRPLQNHEAFSFFDPFVAANEATYETAGSLGGGSRVWVLARINRDPIILNNNDQIDKYILLSNGHDGKIAVRVGFTATRVVCANTLSMAHNSDVSKLIRVRHSSRMMPTLSDVRMTMDTIDQSFKATGEMYDKLSKAPISKKDLAKYVSQVFDAPEDSPPRCLSVIEKNFDSGIGSDIAGPTAWGAYNAVTDYLTWEQGRSAENRLDANA